MARFLASLISIELLLAFTMLAGIDFFIHSWIPMQTLTFSTTITAPASHVWQCMLDKPTYEERTKAFDPSSTYEGSWEQGASIKFLSSAGTSTGEGMISEIAENRPNKFLSIRHL